MSSINPSTKGFAWRIELGPAAPTTARPPEDTRVLSPNRAYRYAVTRPDFKRPGPWTTAIHIHNDRDRLLRLALRDHGNTTPKIKWINDKLLYVEIWWGRIPGSTPIPDVETERTGLREMVWDGGLLYRQYFESAPLVK